jgi:hypothetical protein
VKTYELKVAAKMILGSDTTIRYPHVWALRRIKRGEFHAHRVGRKYCMSTEQIAEARAK